MIFFSYLVYFITFCSHLSGFWVIEKRNIFLESWAYKRNFSSKNRFWLNLWIFLTLHGWYAQKIWHGFVYNFFFKLYSYIKDTISIMWIFVKVNLLSWWLSLVIGRLPSNTWILTVFRLSAAVEKIWDFLVGITVLQEIILHYKGQQLQELNPYLLIWNLVHCCL